MSQLTVATTQMTCSWDIEDNLNKAERLIREAAGRGAQVILIQELFQAPYFCIEQDFKHQELANTLAEEPSIQLFQKLAAELNVVLPCSWYEKAGLAYFNSMAMIDANGSVLGVYRKSHIPNGPGYQEKQYFNPGDTGFKVWDTIHGRIGVGICWDQWFPETTRCMALAGAELLMYPSAIGSEPPPSPPYDSSGHWRRTMQGHAAANMMPLVASNRIGREVATQDENYHIDFYGNAFIADETGEIVELADDHSESILTHTFDMDAIRAFRESWGVYRDRRPDLYDRIMTLDGKLAGDR